MSGGAGKGGAALSVIKDLTIHEDNQLKTYPFTLSLATLHWISDQMLLSDSYVNRMWVPTPVVT